ncbi:hypothetical protein BDQ12DRAFT_685981 [Crucibulum laeve]|uniref:Uncharacterized protein n=1 Tax=Crucibulum laeve TaxID=68775 RepID=A0A5C3LVK9_9AGAR|nr:hypothetical protein BDQ12DRAFT_685981 [Crucibulum laeve]
MASTIPDNDIRHLLGLHPSDSQLKAYISSFSLLANKPEGATPEVKSYSDAVYFNYFSLGISLLFIPTDRYKPATGLKLHELQDQHLVLDSIDIYNISKPKAPVSKATSTRSSELAFTTFPLLPFVLKISLDMIDKEGKPLERPPQLDVLADTSGKDFVNALGEPDRKGGGAGPSSGSIGIWCEWSKDGIMVEFGGDEAKGPQAWERGKDAIWKTITIFPPGSRDA